jgi:MFS family permease
MENKAAQKTEKLISKDFILVMIASLGTAFCNFIFFTALPLYAQKVSGSDLFSGLMITMYSAAALVARPVSGIISDKSGRVPLMIIGAAICAAACALYGVTTAMLLLLVIRVINGFGFGIHSTCAGAVPADILPKSRMSEGIGYFSLYSTIATALGPFVALAILGNREMRDFKNLFFFAAGLCVMSLVCNCFITYERKRRKQALENGRTGEHGTAEQTAEPEAPETALPKTFLGFEYTVFLPMAVLILLFFGQTSINTFLTLIAARRGLGNIGLFFTISAACLFVSRFVYAKLMDKHGPDVLVIPGIVGIVVCLVLIPFVHSMAMLYIIAVPMGFANGAVYPSINTLLFLRCSPQRRGTASAAYFSSIDIGFGIGGLALGIVADALDYSAVYYVAAALSFVALVLYLKAVAVRKPLKPALQDNV